MAKEDKAPTAKAPTKYRVLKHMGETELALDDEGTSGTAVETFALLPGEYDGNAIKKAAAEHGGGDYVKVAVSGFDRKSVTIDTSPRIRVG